MNRRDLLKKTLVGAGMAAGLGSLPQWSFGAEDAKPSKAKEAVLKLCSQDGRIPGANLAEKVKKLEAWGAAGIEFGGDPNVQEIKPILADSKLKVSALCWGSDNGNLVSMDLKVRQGGIDKLKKALEKAGELGANGVIFVPCFHKQSDLKPEELDKVLMEILPGLGDFAQQHKTHILLEPLCKNETFYINSVVQAAKICDMVKNPGIAQMGDFFHMSTEDPDQKAAFLAADKHLLHVHMASRKSRNLPGTDDDNYVEGFRGLKLIGYQQFVSLECGIKKGQNPEEAIPACFDLLRKQWEEATV
ncbi:MAG TPA: sugar phosphate isomerase/epimerase family protein [Candidatus Sumerlaeota bacterium]|nr:sugar phosphate isomerase/epimerase family protein [Candidatus Sumerlaeota bacterium]HPS01168.1 sugar phosphate isomerase/epimerase family protein [Candidatus Sumerlaeota bacterium]